MPRLALLLVFSGLVAILLTLLMVVGDAMLPGRVPPFAAAMLAAFGGVSLVGGLFLVEPGRDRQPFSG
jgi:FtsH-binding integral membrane protein